ncbi:unnamed protein product [Cyclocybe aegerita]|uniref:Uncharacterized protein n=1 Tax=Cyclocybe aegerita TaxID=1973307 RepID=A0A8S0XPA6_CYCAE|nr:unnamed protein product [Cyclocybe aegerita]
MDVCLCLLPPPSNACLAVFTVMPISLNFVESRCEPDDCCCHDSSLLKETDIPGKNQKPGALTAKWFFPEETQLSQCAFHLQREREALFAAYASLHPDQSNPSGSSKIPVTETNKDYPLSTPPLHHLTTLTTPTRTSDLAPPPGTPLTDRWRVALFAQECCGVSLIAEALMESEEETGHPDLLEPLMDDNWEDPTDPFTNVELPGPSPPPQEPATASVEVLCPSIVTGVPDIKMMENTPDPFC